MMTIFVMSVYQKQTRSAMVCGWCCCRAPWRWTPWIQAAEDPSGIRLPQPPPPSGGSWKHLCPPLGFVLQGSPVSCSLLCSGVDLQSSHHQPSLGIFSFIFPHSHKCPPSLCHLPIPPSSLYIPAPPPAWCSSVASSPGSSSPGFGFGLLKSLPSVAPLSPASVSPGGPLSWRQGQDQKGTQAVIRPGTGASGEQYFDIPFGWKNNINFIFTTQIFFPTLDIKFLFFNTTYTSRREGKGEHR